MAEVIIHKTKPNSKNMDYKSIYMDQILELAEVLYPSKNDSEYLKLSEMLMKKIKQVYIEFPWRRTLLECVGEREFYKLKTNRNQLLIEKDAQSKLHDLNISIAGMSVGSSILYGLIGTGIGKNINIADDDIFSTTNLNRVSASLLDVEESKVHVAYRRAKEMDPFINLAAFNTRINEANINEFMFDGSADIIFEEIDDIKMKVAFREYAKSNSIPLVMLTNIGDIIMIDVERYDLNNQLPLFNGHVEQRVIDNIKSTEITAKLLNKHAVDIVNEEFLSNKITKSISEIGKTLVGRPQLYSTVAMDSGLAPYLTRRIFIDGNLKSGRYSLNLSRIDLSGNL